MYAISEGLKGTLSVKKHARILDTAKAMRLSARWGPATASCRRAFSSTPRQCFRSSFVCQKKAAKKSPTVSSSKIELRMNDKRVEGARHGGDPMIRIRRDLNAKYGSRHDQFRKAVLARFKGVLEDLLSQDFAVLGVTKDEIRRQAGLFMDTLDDSFILAEQNITRRDKNPLFWNLREAFIRHDSKGVGKEVRYAFQSFMMRDRFSKNLADSQQRLLDFRFPQEWFPGTREMQRTIHVHVGPTNSGKTYNAIKALENAKSGVFAGPLRLLAAEVYHRFTARGIPCALITGEEIRVPEDTDKYFTACTVEMIPLNCQFDVAVIDEIQMLGDLDRGNAWTTALLGVQAKEVHVCGEERAAKLVQSICATIGDKCVIHRYERLSPLETQKTALDNNLGKLQKGDAIVAFNRLQLHALKRKIEKYTGRRCAIIYGTLPPEVRVQQAALFNDPDNDYDFVVASDAIGMGLNLEIRRVILDAVNKFDGNSDRPLTYPEIKQIGGRAGRFRTAANPDGTQGPDQPGLVTTMESLDLSRVQTAFNKPVEDMTQAYIQPPPGIVERFASYYPPSTPLSFILMRIRTAAILGERFKLHINSDILQIADHVQHIPLSIHDRLVLCFMPARLGSPISVEVLQALARIIANNEVGDLLSIKEIPLEHLEIDMSDVENRGQEFLHKMEDLHVAINQYVWLSYRYAGMFRNQGLAFHIRSLVEERLIQLLERLDFTDNEIAAQRRKLRARAQITDSLHERMGDLSDGEEPHELPIGDEHGEHPHEVPAAEQPEESLVKEDSIDFSKNTFEAPLPVGQEAAQGAKEG